MAAPHVTGLVATLMDHQPEFRYRPALVRAHLMASGILHDDDTTPADNDRWQGRRDEYGLGRVSSYLAHWAEDSAGGWFSTFAWGHVTRTGYAQVDVAVPSGSQRLVAVAVWDEPAPSPGSTSAVIYDLDLWIDHNGDCNAGDCGEWASQSTEDNVEYVIIDNPPAGSYSVKLYPHNGRGRNGVPVGISVTVIRGDPTPSMRLTATPSTPFPVVGQELTITTTVSTPSYVASGVHLALVGLPESTRHSDTRTTRADGVTMRFPEIGRAASELTLGNVVTRRDRSVTWTFVPTVTGRHVYNFRAWSENGGTRALAIRESFI